MPPLRKRTASKPQATGPVVAKTAVAAAAVKTSAVVEEVVKPSEAIKIEDATPFVVANRLPSALYNIKVRAGTGPVSKTYYENTTAIQHIQLHFNTPQSVDVTSTSPPKESVVIDVSSADGSGETLQVEIQSDGSPYFIERVTLPWTITCGPPNQLIPRIIHQTYISRAMPAESFRACQTWWLTNPEYEYRFYDDALSQKLMENWFAEDSPVLQAYNMLYAGAYKSDIFRLALLFREGGVWADVSSVCEAPLSTYVREDDELIVCVDSPCQVRYANIHQAYIFAIPEHPAIAHILDYTVSTVIHRRFETPGMVFQSIAVTGPTAFAEGLNDYLDRRSAEFFEPGTAIHLFKEDNISENPFRFTPYVTDITAKTIIRYLDHRHSKIWIAPDAPAVITTKFPNFSQFRKNVHYSVLGNMGYVYKVRVTPWSFVTTPSRPIWQVWLQTEYVSKQMAAAMSTWHDASMGTYCFVTEKTARAATEKLMPEVWQAIDTVRPHAYKCDLLRALLLYQYGGLYVDADMVCLQSLEPLLKYDIVLLSSGSEQVDNGLIYFKNPRHPVLLHFLQRAVAQIKARVSVSSDLALTGPRLWTACAREFWNWRAVPNRSAWSLFGERIAILKHDAVTPTYAESATVVDLKLDEQRMNALRTVAPGTTVVTWADVPYVCTKYPDYNKERLIMGGTNFAAEFHSGQVFSTF